MTSWDVHTSIFVDNNLLGYLVKATYYQENIFETKFLNHFPTWIWVFTCFEIYKNDFLT